MARLPRLSVGGWPHLLTLRGHNQQPVFLDAADTQHYRALLAEVSKACGVLLHAYALTGHEVRLLATPVDATALSRMMQGIGRRYGSYFNRRHGRSGSLWEGRFRATIVEPERHVLDAVLWIEEVEPNDTSVASSRAHHLGQGRDPLVSDHARFWSLGNTPFEREITWRRQLEQGIGHETRDRLVQAVLKGWPLGSDSFVKALAEATPRRLTPLRRGRPAKMPAVSVDLSVPK